MMWALLLGRAVQVLGARQATRALHDGILESDLGQRGTLSTRWSADSMARRPDSGPVRVLFVSHSAELAGAEQSLLGWLKRLDRDRFEPTVLLPAHGPFEDRAHALGVPTVRARYSWWIANRNGPLPFLARFWWSVLNMPALIRAARRLDPDVIHTNSLVVPQGAVLAKILGVPHIWHIREVLPNSTLNTPLPRDLLLSLVLRLSSSVIAVSESSRSIFRGLHGSHVSVVYNGVEQSAEAREDHDRVVRIARGAIRLAVVGTMTPVKRTLDAIKAVAILREYFPGAQLSVVGRGQPPYERTLRRYVVSHGLEGYVAFLGHRDDVSAILAGSDLLVMPAWPEAFGLVTIEALSVGTPVIGANTSGTAEILRHGGGVLVEPGRPDLIAEAVRVLLSAPERYFQLRMEAQTAARAFSIEREVTSIEEEILRTFGHGHAD